MLVIRKFRVVSLIVFFPTILFFASCTEDDNGEEVDKTVVLSFEQSSLPEALDAAGGSFTLEINWAYTQWELTTEVVEEEDFILSINPSGGGSIKEEETSTFVEITYDANSQTTENRQRIILTSPRHEVALPSSATSAVSYTTSSGLNRNLNDNILNEDNVIVELPKESITTIVL